MDNVEGSLLERYRTARRNAARKIQNALFDTLAGAISEESNIGPHSHYFNDISSHIFKNKDLLIEALDDKTENSFKNRIVDELRKLKQKDDLESLTGNKLLIRLLSEMSTQLKDSEQELSAINTIVDRFNEFTGENKRLLIDTQKIWVETESTTHSINQLSSGERHITRYL
eukprot:TRINITY_DN204_c0_g1_i11.p1 TRINITY_DN204_c0_g1~~TRINITY_DN204_c0_g1_i11.p1  ORF type:complete len:171 (-),score=14.24 TRINITY_DN204_c0_g1_i11:167-679(-)